MSRTRRKHLDGEYIIQGKIIHWNDIDWGVYPLHMGFHYRIRVIKNQRDRKPWGKPPKWFKQMNRRWERNKVKQAIRNEQEVPLFKKTDRWEWT